MQIKLENFLFFRVFYAYILKSRNCMKTLKNLTINKENTQDLHKKNRGTAYT